MGYAAASIGVRARVNTVKPAGHLEDRVELARTGWMRQAGAMHA